MAYALMYCPVKLYFSTNKENGKEKKNNVVQDEMTLYIYTCYYFQSQVDGFPHGLLYFDIFYIMKATLQSTV